MMNPVNDVIEDPDNADVLYLATDYGLLVSWDRGGNWTRMQGMVGRGNQAVPAPDVIIYDIDIQERERDMGIGTYGRGIYLADIWPVKEFSDEVFAKASHLFEPQRVVNWSMIERKGPTYGEFAWVENPRSEASIYYYLKEDVDKVRIVITDLEGNEVSATSGDKSSGLHKSTWNLRARRISGAGGRGGGGQRPGGFGSTNPAGTYKVMLEVNDEVVMTHNLRVVQDPILNPDKP